MKHIAVAIDGPSGAGKSTIARLLAKKFHLYHLDTGTLFRCLELYAEENNLDINDPAAINTILQGAVIKIQVMCKDVRYSLNNSAVDKSIRTESIGHSASLLSQNAAMRNYVLELEREFAAHNNVIMDGRDIGTVVLPQADVKIYLDARPEERASRRWQDLNQQGLECDYTSVLNQINQRDFQDINRLLAPLKQAKEAVYIDSSQMDIQEVLERISAIIQPIV